MSTDKVQDTLCLSVGAQSLTHAFDMGWDYQEKKNTVPIVPRMMVKAVRC